MIKQLLIGSLLLMGVHAKAQTWDEWFKQKKTQRKYLLEQIAALKMYSGYLQKGYTIVKDGLHTIEQIKNGDLSQHSGYFLSLKTVNPHIQKYPSAKAIVDRQVQIDKLVKTSRKQVVAEDNITDDERQYIYRVYDRLQADCHATLEELETILTNSELDLKDDERIRRLDKLFSDTRSQWSFANSFTNSIALLTMARQKEQNDIKYSRELHGIK